MWLRTMGIFNLETISKYFALTVYVATAARLLSVAGSRVRSIAADVLAIMFGPAWALAVCGLLVNNVYYKGIAKRDRTTVLGRRVGDVFGHALPALLVTLYAPDQIPLTKCTYSAGIIVLVALLVPWLRRVYIGVPGWVTWGLAPAVALAATHLRYWPPRL